MARRLKGIPVSELASDLRISPSELRRRLGQAGLLRHVMPDDSIPAGMVDNVATAVRRQASPAQPPSAGLDLDSLMAATGVKPMKRSPTPRPQQAPRPQPAPRAQHVQHRDPKVPAAALAPLQELATRLVRAKSANAELAVKNRELEREMDTLRLTLAKTQARALEAQESAHALQVSAGEEGVSARLSDLLETRGLIGEDERNAAIRALIDVRRWDAIAADLKPLDPSAARSALELFVVMACGRGQCETPKGMGCVQVTPRRCEVCGGEGPKRHLRRLGDAMLLHGLRRVALVGGPAGYRRMVRENLDERIRMLTGSKAAAVDLEGVQCLILWGDTPVPEVSMPTLHVQGRGLVQLVDAVRAGFAAGLV
ncbi:MAG: hypothetical protein ACI9VR_004024 [Cognaticolwellia sp.]|jgi:hypothetical protein